MNGITAPSQTFSTTTDATSTTPSFTSSGTVHTLNIPLASEIETTPATAGTTAGLISKLQYNTLNNKQSALTAGQGISISGGQAGPVGSGVYTVDIIATDADSEDKGIIKLAGDLTGTAELPRINTVGGVLSSTITTVASSVLSATSNNTASTLVQRDGSGGFAAGAVTATSVVSSGSISSTSLNTGTLTATSLTTGTLKVTGGSYTNTNTVLTNDGSGNAIWQTASGGITGVGTITTTTQANGAAISGTSTLVLAAASSLSPGVLTTGTQTIAGNKTFSGTLSTTTLTLTGNLTGTSASFSKAVTGAPAGAFSSTSIDFTNSNLAYSTYTLGSPTFNLIGLKDGGTYTLAWQVPSNRGGTTALFSSPDASLSFRSLGNYPVVSSKDAIYTFVVIGTRVYYSMISVE